MYRKTGRNSVGNYLTVMDAGMFNSLHWGWSWWRDLGQSEASKRCDRLYVRQRTVINKGWPLWAAWYRVRKTSVVNDASDLVQTMTFHLMEDCVWTIVCTTIIPLCLLKWTKARCGPIETLCCKVLYWNMTLSETNKKSHRWHGYLSLVMVVRCQVEVTATSWSVAQRSPTDCGASLCVI